MACCRRRFLGKCAACIGAAGALTAPAWLSARAPERRKRIRIVYALHAPRQVEPDWPNVGFDFAPVMDRIGAGLAEQCPALEFVSSLATGKEQAAQILARDRSEAIDGYLVFQMNCWNQVVQTLAAAGQPVLYVDFPFGGSGGFLVYNAALLRSQASNVGFVASSRLEDVAAAARCFETAGTGMSFAAATAAVRRQRTPRPGAATCQPDRLDLQPVADCVRQMKATKILAVRGQESEPAGDILGIPVVRIPFADVNEAWKAADADEARSVADRWQRAASRVEGVSRATLEASAAMYLAQKAMLKKHGATGITIDCLGGFYGGHIHAYPCLGFHELLNEGLVGACECDVRSTGIMVAVGLLTRGRPGYISDPVIDTAKRQIVYAHCVASNRAFGPRGPANPFEILTHSEDRQGASVRSLLPVGYMTTTVETRPERREILLHRAKAVANDPDDRACRTKLCAEPIGDLERLFGAWDEWGWHRVTFYGDLEEPVRALADAIGWKVVEEA